MTRSTASTFTAFAAAAAAFIACGSGCEERVVRTNNTWIGSQYEHAEKTTIGVMQPPPPKGPIEAVGDGVGDVVSGTGDLLFGWMDDKPRRQQAVKLPDADITTRVKSETRDGQGATR